MSQRLLSTCTCLLRASSVVSSPSSTTAATASSRSIATSATTLLHHSTPVKVPANRPQSPNNYDNLSEQPGFRKRTRQVPNVLQPDREWRSTKTSQKKEYLNSPESAVELLPRVGQAQINYLRLEPEARRREDAARQRLLREYSPNKLYALERERERILKANLARRADAPTLLKAAKNVFPTKRHEPKASEFNAGVTDARHGSGRGIGKMLRGMEHRRAPMVAGSVNRDLWKTAAPKKSIEPVVRGGAPKGPTKKPKRVKVMKKVTLPTTMRLENLTNLLGVKLFRLQKAMESVGLTNTRPERLLTAEDASLIAMELNFDPSFDDEAAFDIYPRPKPEGGDLPLRPPVTGIFGHVDHGKTSLLDALRSTTVAAGEAGGITQHIGAFEVSVSAMTANLRARADGEAAPPPPSQGASEDTITFLDTPGHAAFTAMRERGAGVTDVVVLVVAADDGVKPQTEEVIGLIKSSDVGVVVAITKVDKPGVDVQHVMQSLMAAGVEVEAFGGDVPCVPVSSVTGQGLPELLETIAAIAEVRELKAERDGVVEGRVIESRVEKGRGNVATVLVVRGCLQPTASLVAGTTWCRVRSLVPPTGKAVTSVFPGQPVEVTGWKELPSAGDLVLEATSEDDAKRAVANRLKRIEQVKLWEDVEIINEKRRIEAEQEVVRKEEEAKAKEKGLTANAIAAAGQLAVDSMGNNTNSGVKELLLIIKADVSGTVEAVVGALEGIGNAEARVKIVSSSVGDIQESDVEMARAVGGSVVGFNVKAPNAVLKSAARAPNPVPIHASPIIYRLVDTIRASVAELLPKTIEIRVHGEATVQQLFSISVKGTKDPKKIAGSKVSNGVFQRARKARVIRNGEVLFTGNVETLKQVKKDVTEITKGVECGIALDGFDSFEPEDVIQSIEEVEVARQLA